MMEKIIPLERLTFLQVLKYVVGSLKWIHSLIFIFCLIVIILGVVLQHISIILPFIRYLIVIYVLGIVLSLAIHEYMHILLIKILTNHQEVKIVANWKKFSIKPLRSITGIKSIIIACSGPLVCVAISTFFISFHLYYNENINILFLLAICYGTHIFNLLPFSGDGLMVMKEIYRLIKRGKGIWIV